MSALVLFDADQRDWTIPELSADSAVPATGRAEIVVVIGFNTASAIQCPGTVGGQGGAGTPRPLRFEDVERLARALAQETASQFKLGSGTSFRWEPVLSLKIPEATDAALCRLVGEAGVPEGQGRFQHVFLLSKDRGLRDAVSAAIDLAGGRRGRPGWQKLSSWTGLPCHWLKLDHAPLVRKWTAPGPAPVTLGKPPATAPLGLVDSPATVSWAGERAVEVHGDLPDIARQVEAAPALLTQVGLTRTAVGGVHRLRRLAEPDAAVQLAPCSERDEMETYAHVPAEIGLEATRLRRHPRQPNSLGDVTFRASGIGGGAVRMTYADSPTLLDTFRTTLPTALACSASGELVVDQIASISRRPELTVRRLHDRELIRTLKPKRFTDTRLTVRFDLLPDEGHGGVRRRLRCKVTGSSNGEHEWWWLEERGRTADLAFRSVSFWAVSHPKLQGVLPYWLSKVAAEPAICRARVPIVMLAPMGSEIWEVSVEQVLGPCQIGAGSVESDGARIALLSLDGSLKSGQKARSMCIQRLSSRQLTEWSEGRWPPELFDELKALPLAVVIPTRLLEKATR